MSLVTCGLEDRRDWEKALESGPNEIFTAVKWCGNRRSALREQIVKLEVISRLSAKIE